MEKGNILEHYFGYREFRPGQEELIDGILAGRDVFSNATLQDMARKKPRTITEFRRVSGVGELKASWYGSRFVERIREYLDSQ